MSFRPTYDLFCDQNDCRGDWFGGGYATKRECAAAARAAGWLARPHIGWTCPTCQRRSGKMTKIEVEIGAVTADESLVVRPIGTYWTPDGQLSHLGLRKSYLVPRGRYPGKRLPGPGATLTAYVLEKHLIFGAGT